MTSFLIIALLLAGASWEGSGLTLQLQVGYTPAILHRGTKGYDYPSLSFGFLEFSEVLYVSHTFSLKAGIKTRNGWELRGIGGLTYAKIPNSDANFAFPSDSPWKSYLTDWTLHELSLGIEGGHRVGFRWGEASIYLGLEGILGKLSGESLFCENKDSWDTFHVTSRAAGLQGHIGIDVPLISLGPFSLQISPMLKGGFLKEQSANIPPGTEWLGPYTLSKWGIALGLTLNYSGEK